MTAFRFLAIGMAASLACNCILARPVVLGVVSEANRAHLNTGAASVGATVYDGDRFSTETGGSLLLRGTGATLQLRGESEVNLRSLPNGAQRIEADLNWGTLAFKSWLPAALEIVADDARIHPAGDGQTIGQVTVVGPKELRICARSGALQFSYHGETETIMEGKSYRVILDLPEESPKQKDPLAPSKWPRGFKIVIIGEVAAVVALGIYELLEPESPDRP